MSWQNDKPTEKQIETFKSLKAEFGYKGKPKTKGEYRKAISELMELQTENPYPTVYNSDRAGWLWAYDDSYLGDQGIY